MILIEQSRGTRYSCRDQSAREDEVATREEEDVAEEILTSLTPNPFTRKSCKRDRLLSVDREGAAMAKEGSGCMCVCARAPDKVFGLFLISCLLVLEWHRSASKCRLSCVTSRAGMAVKEEASRQIGISNLHKGTLKCCMSCVYL